MGRQSRIKRRSGVRVVLSRRDEALLAALGRFRAAATSDLTRLVFREVRKDTAAKRLRRLFDAGYLEVHSGDRAKESIYSLGSEGRAWLRRRGRTVGRMPRGGLEHHLAVVRTWVDIAVLVHETAGTRLRSVRPDWELRQDRGHDGLIPDLLVSFAVAAVEGRADPVTLAVEVDLGTEPLWVLRKKVAGYAGSMNISRGGDLTLAVVLPAPGRRQDAVVDLLERSWPSTWCTWTLVDGPKAVLGRLLSGGATPLTASPHREGSEGDVTGNSTRTRGVRAPWQ